MNNTIKERFTLHDLREKAGSDANGNAQILLGHASAAEKKTYERKLAKVTPIR